MEAKKNCEEFLVCYSNKKEEKYLGTKFCDEFMQKGSWDRLPFIIAPVPWLTSARRSQTPEVTPCDAPHPEMMGLALPGISLFLAMHWSHMGARFSMAQNRSWHRCGLPVLMVSCIPDGITTRNRFFSSLKQSILVIFPPLLEIYFISQKV